MICNHWWHFEIFCDWRLQSSSIVKIRNTYHVVLRHASHNEVFDGMTTQTCLCLKSRSSMLSSKQRFWHQHSLIFEEKETTFWLLTKVLYSYHLILAINHEDNITGTNKLWQIWMKMTLFLWVDAPLWWWEATILYLCCLLFFLDQFCFSKDEGKDYIIHHYQYYSIF